MIVRFSDSNLPILQMIDECADLWFDCRWLEPILAAMGARVVCLQVAEVCAMFAEDARKFTFAIERSRQLRRSFELLLEIIVRLTSAAANATARTDADGLSTSELRRIAEALGCAADGLVDRLVQQLVARDSRALEVEAERAVSDPEWFSDL